MDRMQEADKTPVRSANTPQVKICGLTRVEEAVACAELGADAIGCVFYPPSPRNLTDEEAERICKALPAHICTVGVFVNESLSYIMEKVEHCGLHAVQLHGMETAGMIDDLLREGLIVIKGLFMKRDPFISSAHLYKPSAFLVECGLGRLPGGNAAAWDWAEAAAAFPAAGEPLILAGGLSPENIQDAILKAAPDAVDVSSGVESEPGRKDIDKVRRFMEAVRRCNCPKKPRSVFK
jgi:phosphoribosylanthranilate isomerase